MEQIDEKDILIIINPNSGKKNVRKVLKEIRSLNADIPYVITRNTGELEQVFRSGIEKYKVFIVAGGDGTVNETIQYLYGRKDKFLAVLPAGSGNGFARELGFGDSLKSLTGDIKKGASLDVDVLSVNGNLCVNVAGLGLDSYVAHVFHKRSGRGLKNYIFSAIRSIFTFRPFYAKLSVGGAVTQGKFLMITIANSRQFGNHAVISPRSDPSDGIFEVVLVKPFPFYLYPVFIFKLFLGTLKNSRHIKYIKVRDSISIESGFRQYHVDGEPKDFTGRLSAKMLREKVRVIKTASYTG